MMHLCYVSFQMDVISVNVEQATTAMQKCMEHVLDERELENIMTAQQFSSLVEPLQMHGVHKPFILHWLELVQGSFDSSQEEGRRITKEFNEIQAQSLFRKSILLFVNWPLLLRPAARFSSPGPIHHMTQLVPVPG